MAPYYYWPGFHEPNGTGECIIATSAWEPLPDDVKAAMEHYVHAIPADRLLSLATHISTDLDLMPVSEAEMAAALALRAEAGAKERSIYAS